MESKRRFSRVNFVAKTHMEFNNNIYEGELLDISLKGALLHSRVKIPLKKGDCCILKIHLHSSDIILTFNAELAHLQQNDLGFKFTSEDVDTMTHLRRLLDLNVGNHDKITDELSFWLKE